MNSISVFADKGFNEVAFDVSFSEKRKKAYQKANKRVKLKEAKNGIFYLLKGKDIVKTGDAESVFEVK